MPEISFRVNAVTVGSADCKFEHLSGGYRWNKTPGWTGGNIPEVRDDKQDHISAPPRKYSAAARQQRKNEYEAIVEANRKANREMSIAEIAREMGLATKTVRRFAMELDPEGYQAADQRAVKREKMRRFTAALAADPDPSRPNVAAASRAAGIPEATGYGYWKQLQDEQAAARSQEAAS